MLLVIEALVNTIEAILFRRPARRHDDRADDEDDWIKRTIAAPFPRS